ncbi:MAG TPA: ion channel [Acidimicrobiales bacterium]|nr:ion channel [Acidimicrobiales bacterium]
MVFVISLLASKVARSQSGRLVAVGVLCLFAGAAAFAATQPHVTFGTALYWAITTATTVGYGDVTPENTVGRVIASLVMLTAIPLFASAFALFAGAVASAHLRRLLGMERREATGGEVVVVGNHPSLPSAVAELVAAGRDVVVVTTADRSSFPDEVHVVAADPTSEAAVRRAKPERASQVLVAGKDDASVLVSAVLVHQLAPGTPAVAIATSPNVCRALRDLGVDAVSGDELVAHTVAKSMEAPHAGELLLRILDSEGFRLKEIDVGEDAAGQPLSAARDRTRGVVLGAVHGGHVVMGVVDDPLLEAGDRLLVLDPER